MLSIQTKLFLASVSPLYKLLSFSLLIGSKDEQTYSRPCLEKERKKDRDRRSQPGKPDRSEREKEEQSQREQEREGEKRSQRIKRTKSEIVSLALERCPEGLRSREPFQIKG